MIHGGRKSRGKEEYRVSTSMRSAKDPKYLRLNSKILAMVANIANGGFCTLVTQALLVMNLGTRPRCPTHGF